MGDLSQMLKNIAKSKPHAVASAILQDLSVSRLPGGTLARRDSGNTLDAC